jgi:sugar-phosphatase
MRLVIDAVALLVDCDGTLVDSTANVERHWEEFAVRRGLNLAQILPEAHGRRSRDVIADLVDPAEVNDETTRFEGREARDTVGVRAMPGAELARTLPSSAWAIVTSGSRAVTAARLVAAGLPIPLVLVSADDVAQGKPAPDGYLLAASALGVNPAQCIAIEDSPAGVAAAKGAGCRVVALSTTHSAEQVSAAHLVLPNLSYLIVKQAGLGLRVQADQDGFPK